MFQEPYSTDILDLGTPSEGPVTLYMFQEPYSTDILDLGTPSEGPVTCSESPDQTALVAPLPPLREQLC